MASQKQLSLDKLYVITDGSGQVVDPLEKVFQDKNQAKEYRKNSWDDKTIKEMNITIESLREVLGL
jgi:hypothetical protein